MRALLAGCLLLSACLEPPEDAAPGEVDNLPIESHRFDPASLPELTPRDGAGPSAVFPAPAGWSYLIYRDQAVSIRSSCLAGSCAPNDKRGLDSQGWDEPVLGGPVNSFARFRWKWYAGELDPSTGNPYPAWIPIHPYFAVELFWGCAGTNGSGPVRDYSSCQGGANQIFTTGGVATYGAPYNTSGRYIDGYGSSRPCWDLSATASPGLKLHACHLGPNQQFQFAYSGCAIEGKSCSTDEDCCYGASGGCNTTTGKCRY